MYIDRKNFMKKYLIVFCILGLIEVGVQLWGYPEHQKWNTSELNAPVAAEKILNRACIDCHSPSYTKPWYGYIPLASWLIVYDIREGQEHLNFSKWNTWDAKKQSKVLDHIVDEVTEGEMPPKPYLIGHPQAKLNENDLSELKNWLKSLKQI